ncbi:hypothetical protein ACIPLC_15300 [Kitasatospora sp. NPDC086801]
MQLTEYPQHYTPDGSPTLYLAGSGTGLAATVRAALDHLSAPATGPR